MKSFINLDDRQLLENAVKGDQSAMTMLVENYSSPLFNHARYMLGGDAAQAEDIVQESFMKMWKNAHQLILDENLMLKAWLFRVLRNLCLDQLRKPAHKFEPLDFDIKSPAQSAEEQILMKEKAETALLALNNLPERQKSAMLMAHFEHMSQAEIALALDCSIEAVENLLARARRSLKAQAPS